MARPNKFYIYYVAGEAASIIEGSIPARRVGAFGAFRTRLEAEEQFAWWNYKAHRPGGHLHHLSVKEADRPKPAPPPCTCCHCKAVRGFNTTSRASALSFHRPRPSGGYPLAGDGNPPPSASPASPSWRHSL